MATIAIIGTGKMAAGLGTGLARAGHTIVFGSRDPAGKAALVAGIPGARVDGVPEATAAGEIVIVTLPYREVEPYAAANAPALRGRLVVDISNPFDALPDNRLAGAEITAAAIGAGARVVAAFKANFSATLLAPRNDEGAERDVLFAGDDPADKQLVAGLIADLGFRPLDCGPLRNARILDGMVPLIIELDQRYGGGWVSSWKLLP